MRRLKPILAVVAVLFSAAVSSCKHSPDSSAASIGVREPGLGANQSVYLYKSESEGRICLQTCDSAFLKQVFDNLAARTMTPAAATTELKNKCTGFKSVTISDLNSFFDPESSFVIALTSEKVFEMRANHPQYQTLMEMASNQKCGDDSLISEVGGDVPVVTDPTPTPAEQSYPRIEAGFYDAQVRTSSESCIYDISARQDSLGKVQSLRAVSYCEGNRVYESTCSWGNSAFGEGWTCRDAGNSDRYFLVLARNGNLLMHRVIEQNGRSAMDLLAKRSGPPRLTRSMATCSYYATQRGTTLTHAMTSFETTVEAAMQEFNQKCQVDCNRNSTVIRCTVSDFIPEYN